MTLHDVLRYLLRRATPHSEAELQDLLLTVDGHEQGFESLEAYKEKLAADRKAAAPPEPTTPAQVEGMTDAQLEAEITRRQALQNAQASQRPTPTETGPIPTRDEPTAAPPQAPPAGNLP